MSQVDIVNTRNTNDNVVRIPRRERHDHDSEMERKLKKGRGREKWQISNRISLLRSSSLYLIQIGNKSAFYIIDMKKVSDVSMTVLIDLMVNK